MLSESDLLDRLEAIPPLSDWRGTVYRHVFGNTPPDRANTRGARWNPSDTPALYTSVAPEVALAEAAYLIGLQPIPPSAPRWLYRLDLALHSVLDLTQPGRLSVIGLHRRDLAVIGHAGCQRVGGLVAMLGHDGLLVPSARAYGSNLVVYPQNRRPGFSFEIVSVHPAP